LSEVQLNCRYC